MANLNRKQLDEICDFAEFSHSELSSVTSIQNWDKIIELCLICFSLNHTFTEKLYYGYYIQEIEKSLISLNKENILKSIYNYIVWYKEQK